MGPSQYITSAYFWPFWTPPTNPPYQHKFSTGQHNWPFSKGQLISKGHFVFNSPKKRTKKFSPCRIGQKFEFLSSFFGRIGDTKKDV